MSPVFTPQTFLGQCPESVMVSYISALHCWKKDFGLPVQFQGLSFCVRFEFLWHFSYREVVCSLSKPTWISGTYLSVFFYYCSCVMAMILNRGSGVPLKGLMAMSRDLLVCHTQKTEVFLAFRDAAKLPTMHRKVPQPRTIHPAMSEVLRLRNPKSDFWRASPMAQ